MARWSSVGVVCAMGWAALAACSLLVDTSDLAGQAADASDGAKEPGDAPSPADALVDSPTAPDAAIDAVVDAARRDAPSWCQSQPPHLLCADFDEADLMLGWSGREMALDPGEIALDTSTFASAPASLLARLGPGDGGVELSARLQLDLASPPQRAHLEFDLNLCAVTFTAGGAFEFVKLDQQTLSAFGLGLNVYVTETGFALGLQEQTADASMGATTAPFSSPITPGVWTHVSVDTTFDPSDGAASVALDGAVVAAVFGVPSESPNTTRVSLRLGVWSTGSAPACASHFDNVTLDVVP